MTTERAIEVLSQYFTHRHHPDVIQQALCKAIEVMTKVHTYDKQMKELEEYLKETRSTGNEF